MQDVKVSSSSDHLQVQSLLIHMYGMNKWVNELIVSVILKGFLGE